MNPTAAPAPEPLRLLRLPDVISRCGLRRSALYAAIAAGRFPPPVKLGARCSAWPSTEVDAWVRARLAERGGGGQ